MLLQLWADTFTKAQPGHPGPTPPSPSRPPPPEAVPPTFTDKVPQPPPGPPPPENTLTCITCVEFLRMRQWIRYSVLFGFVPCLLMRTLSAHADKEGSEAGLILRPDPVLLSFRHAACKFVFHLASDSRGLHLRRLKQTLNMGGREVVFDTLTLHSMLCLQNQTLPLGDKCCHGFDPR